MPLLESFVICVQVIIRGGETVEAMYTVLTGRLRSVATLETDRTSSLREHTHTRGACVGVNEMLGGHVRSERACVC